MIYPKVLTDLVVGRGTIPGLLPNYVVSWHSTPLLGDLVTGPHPGKLSEKSCGTIFSPVPRENCRRQVVELFSLQHPGQIVGEKFREKLWNYFLPSTSAPPGSGPWWPKHLSRHISSANNCCGPCVLDAKWCRRIKTQ